MDPKKREAIESAVEALIEGAEPEAAARELDALLRDDPEAQRLYLRRIDLHHALRWQAAGRATYRSFSKLRASAAARRRRSPARFVAAAAVAAGLLVLLVRRPDDRPAVEGVATLAPTERPVWDGPAPSRALGPGRLRLRGGAARIGWNSGAETLLQGPADFEIAGPARALLRSGAATVGVPHGGTDFELAAAGLDLTTRGAEFGLRTDGSGLILLQVFEGEVLARVQGPSTGIPRTLRLTRDESFRVDPDGTLTAHIIGDAAVFPRLRRVADPDVPVVVNPSFEYPKAGPSGQLAAAGWMLQVHPLANVDNMDVDTGAGVVGARKLGDRAPSAPHGEQWGYLTARTFPDGRQYHTSMHQPVGRLVAGARYVLSASASVPGGASREPALTLGLYAGSPEAGPVTLLREWHEAPGPGIERDWRCPPDHPAAGQTLFLHIASVAGAKAGLRQVLVDDVRLVKEK
jgi:hypothetical protein